MRGAGGGRARVARAEAGGAGAACAALFSRRFFLLLLHFSPTPTPPLAHPAERHQEAGRGQGAGLPQGLHRRRAARGAARRQEGVGRQGRDPRGDARGGGGHLLQRARARGDQPVGGRLRGGADRPVVRLLCVCVWLFLGAGVFLGVAGVGEKWGVLRFGGLFGGQLPVPCSRSELGASRRMRCFHACCRADSPHPSHPPAPPPHTRAGTSPTASRSGARPPRGAWRRWRRTTTRAAAPSSTPWAGSTSGPARAPSAWAPACPGTPSTSSSPCPTPPSTWPTTRWRTCSRCARAPGARRAPSAEFRARSAAALLRGPGPWVCLRVDASCRVSCSHPSRLVDLRAKACARRSRAAGWRLCLFFGSCGAGAGQTHALACP